MIVVDFNLVLDIHMDEKGSRYRRNYSRKLLLT